MDIENAVFTRGDLAKLFDLSPRRINQLAKEGILTKHSHGKYKMIEAIQRYWDYRAGHCFLSAEQLAGVVEDLESLTYLAEEK